jgi:hypothetical protein
MVPWRTGNSARHAESDGSDRASLIGRRREPREQSIADRGESLQLVMTRGKSVRVLRTALWPGQREARLWFVIVIRECDRG